MPSELPAVSPTLTPALPEPMPPSSRGGATPDELNFFDRVRKFVSNKQTFNEFLKLCNLFSQDLIDKHILVQKATNFIGGNAELMTWFKNFLKWDGRDEVIENMPRINGKVKLSNCRGLGPSYRLLPRVVSAHSTSEHCYRPFLVYSSPASLFSLSILAHHYHFLHHYQHHRQIFYNPTYFTSLIFRPVSLYLKPLFVASFPPS